MFLHEGWDHTLGNMLFLAIFGKNVEDAFEPLLYLACHFAAMMTQTAMTSGSARQPTDGCQSSAPVAPSPRCWVLYSGSRVLTWIFPVFVVRIPAWIFLGRVVPVPADRGRRNSFTIAARPARQPVLQPVTGSRLDRVGPGRAQPGVQLLALFLQRLNDVLLGPAADLVPPARAIRTEALAEHAAPAAPALPAVPAVGAARALVIEDDVAPVLATLPAPGNIHRWFPL